MFKDLKQILRKEQVDASILLTANVPAAKKIIVHGPQGPEEGGIPSQFPLGEDVQFIQILREAQDFFGIEEEQTKEYFLVDHRTSKTNFESISDDGASSKRELQFLLKSVNDVY